MRIAYLTGRTWRGQAMARLALPDQEVRDHALICAAGAARGLHFETRYWDDPELSGAGFDAALVRSCWDYTQRADAFFAAMDGLEQGGLRLFNPAALMRWNGTKTYLRHLGGVPVIDTIWNDTALDCDAVARAFDALGGDEIVIKPQVGAGSRNTIRLRRDQWRAADLLHAPAGAAMMQRFLPSIETEGELSLLWFGDAFSHAVRKVPHAGAWYANKIEAARVVAETPSASVLRVAEAARAAMPEGAFYVRIDVVNAGAEDWRVIEVEAIEPYLFLAFAPEGAGVLTGALAKVLAG